MLQTLLTCIGIRSAVLNGDMDLALQLTQRDYPEFLGHHRDVYFKLRCRKFIEMIRQCNEQLDDEPFGSDGLSNGTTSDHRVDGNLGELNGHVPDASGDSLMDDSENAMDLDQPTADAPAEWAGGDTKMSLDAAGDDNGDYTVPEHGRKRSVSAPRRLEQTIAYGQEMMREFAGDPRREVRRALEDTFALIAYQDARQSALAPLLQTSGRIPVADELNAAILGTWVVSVCYGTVVLTSDAGSLASEAGLNGAREDVPGRSCVCRYACTRRARSCVCQPTQGHYELQSSPQGLLSARGACSSLCGSVGEAVVPHHRRLSFMFEDSPLDDDVCIGETNRLMQIRL